MSGEMSPSVSTDDMRINSKTLISCGPRASDDSSYESDSGMESAYSELTPMSMSENPTFTYTQKREKKSDNCRKRPGPAEKKKIAEIRSMLDRTEKNERYVIQPEHPLISYWDIWTIVLLAFTAIMAPIEMAFLKVSVGNALFYINRFVDMCFAGDIVLNFFLVYHDSKKGRKIMDQSKIALRYVKSWFFLDLAATVPYDWITYSEEPAVPTAESSSAGDSVLRYLRLLRFLKLLRLLRMTRIVARWQVKFGIRYSVVSLWYLVFGTLGLAHIGACVWGLIEEFSEGEVSWMDGYGVSDEGPEVQYLAAFYWSIMTITTIGYGDVGVTNDRERLIASIFMMLGASVYAYIVGAICSIFSGMDVAQYEFKNKMDKLNEYMSDMAVEYPVRIEMRNYFIKNQERFQYLHHNTVLEHMSPGLQREFSKLCHESWVKDEWKSEPNFLLTKSPDKEIQAEGDRLRGDIVTVLTLETFPAQEEIIGQTERAENMYIVKKGLVAKNGRIITKREAVGTDIILNFILDDPRRPYSVMALTFVDVFCLCRDRLLHVFTVGDFPNFTRSIRRYAIKLALKRELLRRSKRMRMIKNGEITEMDLELEAQKMKGKKSKARAAGRDACPLAEKTLPTKEDIDLLTKRLDFFITLAHSMEIINVDLKQ